MLQTPKSLFSRFLKHHPSKTNMSYTNFPEINQSVLDYICWKKLNSRCLAYKCGDTLPSVVSYNKGFIRVRSMTSKLLKINIKNINECQRFGNIVFLNTTEHGEITINFKSGTMSRATVHLVQSIIIEKKYVNPIFKKQIIKTRRVLGPENAQWFLKTLRGEL